MSELRLTEVCFSRGEAQILNKISVEFKAGEFVALIGPNGAGKTSLLKLALGLQRPSRGEVYLAGQPLSRLSLKARAARIAWLPQRWEPSERQRVIELVAAARYRFDEPYPAARRAALVALERVGASLFAEKDINQLSGGEQQRVLIACALAQEAELLLLDEPGNHLDPGHQLGLYQLLSELRAEGRGVLCVTHDVNLLAQISGQVRLLGLCGGRLQEQMDGAEQGGRKAFLEQVYGSPFIASTARLGGEDVEYYFPASSYTGQRRAENMAP